ncbi:uncharacterized protein TRIADDRAFT_24279 [Trichoplax adhaerens]|uniref:Exostosin GT47 domain-containing protein n=1 Tax=Trichoplax adhaerens TaxID=10228 RepID=B3RVD9_TRIAD|nr:hypothetical protein TRIADDRAFT_24279 [Trichoplax adhaerens]EDV25977.1 hypothetical protein TRIADDRAFT_24279 [Trichoplax adhaerens]|eukprot:XP_002112010.1 hypothetical protein TRIADDRAFT_24279 [Trichoplax adhaerens]
MDHAIILQLLVGSSTKTVQQCRMHTCFDLNRCGLDDHRRLTVYVYPRYLLPDLYGISDPVNTITREYRRMLQAIIDSPFYVDNPKTACLLIPSYDVLNQRHVNLQGAGLTLTNLPYWNQGKNHLLFNMLPGQWPHFNTSLDARRGRAMLAGGGFSSLSYRYGFDISIPIYSLHQDDDYHQRSQDENYHNNISHHHRPWLLLSSQLHYDRKFDNRLMNLANDNRILILQRCSVNSSHKAYYQRCSHKQSISYPTILQDSTFCLMLRGYRLIQSNFLDALKFGCIPVVLSDEYILPFSEVLDWKRAALVFREDQLLSLPAVLSSISTKTRHNLRKQGMFFWQSYFKSLELITLTTLQIINDRIFYNTARSYSEWNEPYLSRQLPAVYHNPPIFYPVIGRKEMGFTVIILTYNRFNNLKRILTILENVASLKEILIIWNKQEMAAPSASYLMEEANTKKPVVVMMMKNNKLSNRFIPFKTLKTDAVFAMDDDMNMLTPDEIEFAYQTWLEYPDRIVGFPACNQLWNESAHQWLYTNDWTNDLSMILTKAAMYHRYYNYLYINNMPQDIKDWVNSNFNCDDIAMNFLIANYTGKPPIKVTPRKRFQCSECVKNRKPLSTHLQYLENRTKCLNVFKRIYKRNPLVRSSFRIDPVLMGDNISSSFQKFPSVGAV